MLCKRLSDGADLLCRSVATVEEAEAVMENKPPHVVIMDFKIGGEGGAKYVNWLLAATTPRRIPVILIVDEANAWQVANHEDKGVYGVLVSPFRMTDLCAMAKNAAAAGERTSSSGSFNPVG
ncbi:MAG: response regulator [Planctomycetes bacterium]|nr:response regulator [Planctomycetota bacterium]